MAKRPTPSKPDAAPPADADVAATPPPVPEHLEAAQAAEAAVADAEVPPPVLETNAAPGAEADVDETPAAPDYPSIINGQILSSVVDADVLALGLSPSQSQAMLDATLAQTLAMAMHNAVIRQQADRVVSQALISAACARMVERSGFAIGAAPPPPAAPSKPSAEKAS